MRLAARDAVHGVPERQRAFPTGAAGFTLVELMIVIVVLGLLTTVGINLARRARAHAEVAACISYQVALQRMLWLEYTINGEYPNNLDGVLANMPATTSIEAEFVYFGGEDANKGHGNDWDGHDGDNPGKKGGGADLPGYYLRCCHDHSAAGVLFVDSGSNLPPMAIRNENEARGTVK
ncbi:MAG: type II secretion system protein [Candidatus Eisenbacteria sp.]|nr:type II secretion system protein [Candidatus Eisenbacteria bacterium]